MQFLHFSFGVGNGYEKRSYNYKNDHDDDDNVESGQFSPTHLPTYLLMCYKRFCIISLKTGATISPFIVGVSLTVFPSGTTSIYIAFWTLAVLSLVSAIPTFLVKSPSLQIVSSEESLSFISSFISAIKQYAVVILVGLYLFLYVGAEASYGGKLVRYNGAIM